MWRDLLADSLEEADAVIFGMPMDNNCSVARGAAKAPTVLRACSEFLPPFNITGEKISSKIFDLGDVFQYDYNDVLRIMRLGCNKKLNLMIGGDHSASILTQKAFRELNSGKCGLIHIDAHADICDEYLGSKYSHACVNRRALENGYNPADITLVGVRSFEDQEKDFLSEHPIDLYTTDFVYREGTSCIVQKLIEKYNQYDRIYLSFDIDALDPSYAPGTGTPEGFGLTSMDVLKIIMELMSALPIRMIDIMEISPPLDVNNITTWLALKFILEILVKLK